MARQARYRRRLLSDDEAWEVVFDLGGMPPEVIDILDAADAESARRRMVKNWFGEDGGRVAWAYYRKLKEPPCPKY